MHVGVEAAKRVDEHGVADEDVGEARGEAHVEAILHAGASEVTTDDRHAVPALGQGHGQVGHRRRLALAGGG